MQQISRKTPMQKCNFTSEWVISCKFAAYFQNTFFNENLSVAASEGLPATL